MQLSSCSEAAAAEALDLMPALQGTCITTASNVSTRYKVPSRVEKAEERGSRRSRTVAVGGKPLSPSTSSSTHA